MKQLLIVSLFLTRLLNAEEGIDWNTTANKFLGKWQCDKITTLKNFPQGMPVPNVKITCTFRKNGTVNMLSIVDDKQKIEKEQYYLFNNKFIVLYDDKDKELFDIAKYEWRIKDGNLELDLLGQAPIRFIFKKIVEQVAAPNPIPSKQSGN